MIGVDLVYIPEFKKQATAGGKVFMDKAFSPSEQKNSLAEHLAGIWAAKEAVLKASGIAVGNWRDIDIRQQADGRLTATVASGTYSVSISHHGDYAVAVAQGVEDARAE